MRILGAFAGGSGHLEPLIPLAQAARRSGHTVAMCGRPWMLPRVEDLGFEAFAGGSDEGLEPVARPLVPVDMTREFRDLREGFVRSLGRQRAEALVAVARAWRPDVVVWEETDVGAGVAAEVLGIPHASFVVTAAGSFVHGGTIGDALDDLREGFGLPPDPGARMLHRWLTLSPVPPSYRDPTVATPVTLHGIRTIEPRDVTDEPRPAWAGSGDRPVVYLTLGTIFNHESGDLFDRCLRALAALPVRALVTVGRELDPNRWGPPPAHVMIERYVPQTDVLPWVDVVVSHGGSGSVLGALGHGVPLVLLPMGADQPLNAERCVAVGVGRTLDVIEATPDDIAAAILEVLRDRAYRTAARRLGDEMAALPPPSVAVAALERLAATRSVTPD